MQNPFEEIIERLDKIEEKFLAVNTQTTAATIEVIDRGELCKRLGITEPTAIRYEKKKKIPAFRIGASVRYNWGAVVEALQNQNN